MLGVARRYTIPLQRNQGVTNVYVSRNELESSAIEGDSPVCENVNTPRVVLKYYETRGIS